MAPRSRFLDLETDDVLFFYGDYHHGAGGRVVSVATHAILFWPVFLAAGLFLHLFAPFPHAAAVCAALFGAYCFLLRRAARPRSPPSSSAGAGPPAALSPTTADYWVRDGRLCGEAGFVSS